MALASSEQFPLPFSTDARLAAIAREFGTPLFVHDEASYRRYGQDALGVPNAFGITVRYAMKANSHRAVLRIFDQMGIMVDASSYCEVRRAMAAGIAPDRIQITSQEVQPLERLHEMVEMGVSYTASSLEQLRRFAQVYPNNRCPLSVRINPGLGSGGNNRTNTGGPAASFGIWHEHLPEVLDIARSNDLTISCLHTHIGSGSDWRVWQKVARMALDIARMLPDATVVNLGGGYKINRMDPAESIDMKSAFLPVKEAFEEFARETGRQLRLEIEPGTYLAANSCLLLAEVADVVDTGAQGYRFIKADASMTELLRPMIYGAQHPIRVLERNGPMRPQVVVGLCCESGDIFTPVENDPEGVGFRDLPPAEVGDVLAIMGAGAYGLAMASKNYNSRPICAEVMIAADGSHRLISRRQEPEEIWARELD